MNKDYQETICWLCNHSIPDTNDRGCPWSILGEPVEGWDATPTYIYQNGESLARSYCVHKCPRFERG